MEIIEILKKNPFFSGLDGNELKKLKEHLKRKDYKKNELVITEHQHSFDMYLIVQGKVNVTVTNEKGKEMTLATLQEGEIFGELSLLDGEPRAASIEALEDCVLFVIKRCDFYELLTSNPQFAIQVIKYLCHRLRMTNKAAESFALLTAYERLKRYYESVAVVDASGLLVINSNESQEAIASRIGCTREMISRILTTLKTKHECIAYSPNKTVILKPLPPKLGGLTSAVKSSDEGCEEV